MYLVEQRGLNSSESAVHQANGYWCPEAKCFTLKVAPKLAIAMPGMGCWARRCCKSTRHCQSIIWAVCASVSRLKARVTNSPRVFTRTQATTHVWTRPVSEIIQVRACGDRRVRTGATYRQAPLLVRLYRINACVHRSFSQADGFGTVDGRSRARASPCAESN